MERSLLQLFPLDRRKFWEKVAAQQDRIQEIRLRAGKPVIVIKSGREYFLEEDGQLTHMETGAYRVEERELSNLLSHICHYSPYAFEDEIRQGFVTVAGGHRVGIAGQVVTEGNGGVRTIKHISYINIRVAHQIIGVADKVLPYIYEKGELKNILIISPPGCGKTTLLRDMIRQISNGNVYGKGRSVGVVDERSEIAGSFLGRAQNDVGIRTDVLDACPKRVGMMLLLRSMSPAVIAIDEIGGTEDLMALEQASACGCKILATIHGDSVEDYFKKSGGRDIPGRQLFTCFLILGKEKGQPVLREILDGEKVNASFFGWNYDCERLPGNGDVVSGAFLGEASNAAFITADSGDVNQ